MSSVRMPSAISPGNSVSLTRDGSDMIAIEVSNRTGGDMVYVELSQLRGALADLFPNDEVVLEEIEWNEQAKVPSVASSDKSVLLTQDTEDVVSVRVINNNANVVYVNVSDLRAALDKLYPANVNVAIANRIAYVALEQRVTSLESRLFSVEANVADHEQRMGLAGSELGGPWA